MALLSLESIRENLLQDSRLSEKLSQRDRARQAMDQAGASIYDAAAAVADVMKGSKNDNARLSAARTVFEIHGALQDENTGLVINLVLDGVQINGILNPDRTSDSGSN